MAGVTLNVRVTPGAQSTRVDAWDGKKVSLRVSAAAEKGKANEAALRLLAGVLGVPVTSLRLVRGQTSRDKLVAVEGLTEDEARQRVERHLADRAGSRKGAG